HLSHALPLPPLPSPLSLHDALPISPSSVRVRFIMDEGPKVRIGEMKFVGNKGFDDGDLRGALKLTKERTLMTIFKSTDKYHRGKDRKSTRLNSSHEWISYAVFCLKK